MWAFTAAVREVAKLEATVREVTNVTIKKGGIDPHRPGGEHVSMQIVGNDKCLGLVDGL